MLSKDYCCGVLFNPCESVGSWGRYVDLNIYACVYTGEMLRHHNVEILMLKDEGDVLNFGPHESQIETALVCIGYKWFSQDTNGFPQKA